MAKKRADGRFVRTFTYCGKKYFVYGHSKQELDEREYLKRTELKSGKEQRDNPTLNQYHARWEDARRGSIKESTLRCQSIQFKNCANVRIESAGRTLGEMRLKEITVDDLREVQKALLDDHRTQTVNDALAHLSHIFHDAVKERRIDYNPCTLVKPLKRTEPKARDTVHRALTLAEQKAFFEAAKDSFYYDAYRMAIYTGMRCGEIGALLLSDIYDDMIHVERTITREETGGYRIGDTAKTDYGRRTIPLNDNIRETLEHQKAINKMLDGENVIILRDRLFKAPERGLLMSTPINREITRICKRIGIEKFQFHALRDTFATRAIESGMNPRTLQEILGHADFSLTMNLYGHVVDDTKKDAMQKLNIAINQ